MTFIYSVSVIKYYEKVPFLGILVKCRRCGKGLDILVETIDDWITL